MNPILFAIISLLPTIQAPGINEGASTSHEPDDCTQCEIPNLASRLVLLLISEDVGGGDLSFMTSHRFHELEAFHNEVVSIIWTVENGNGTSNRRGRLEYFSSAVNQFLLLLVQNACSSHCRLKISHTFKGGRVLVYQTKSTYCLCVNNEAERSTLSAPLNLPMPKQSGRYYQTFKMGNVLLMEETVVYHIVPLSLITKFFQLWLSDKLETYPTYSFNECAQTLFGRLKRSMQKILLVSMRKSGLFFGNNNFSVMDLIGSNSWFNGNMFIGPANRGFLHSAEVFEYEVEPIVGRDQFRVLMILFHSLEKFVRQVPRMSLIQRLVYGFNLFVSMSISLTPYGVTPMDNAQWEEVSDSSGKYWAIKKPRARRSNPDVPKGYSAKQKWSFFISDVMMVTLEARSKEKSLTWSGNFTRLIKGYDEFRKFGAECARCIGFDEYLYLKISGSEDWNRCNSDIEWLLTSEWCLAWRRVVANLNTEEDSMRLPRYKSYLQDVETLISWLSSKVDYPKIETSKNRSKNFASSLEDDFYLQSSLEEIVIAFKSDSVLYDLASHHLIS